MSTSDTDAGAMPTQVFSSEPGGAWLFGRSLDLWVFGGSAVLSFFLLGLGAQLGLLDSDLPPWAWVICIVMVDVAHVWSTIFRVYLDPVEMGSRPVLYLALPAVCYAALVMAYAVSGGFFWTVLSYLAVYHFVRQQAGWVSLYRRRAGERGQLDRLLDFAAIYAATLYPVIYWHAHLPRAFHWFVPGDFLVGLAVAVADGLWPVYWGIMLLFMARQLQRALTGQRLNTGKLLVVLTTWACWHVGIISLNSDFAFAVTNVLIHGLPYMALTYRHAVVRGQAEDSGSLVHLARLGLWLFVPTVVLLASAEEALWKSLVWHGPLDPYPLTFLVPLLALPQATHYALDGFIWRVRPHNPLLMEELAT